MTYGFTHYGTSILTLLLIGIVYVRRKELGFLFLLIAHALSLGVGMAIGLGALKPSQIVIFVISYLPVAFTLIGWLMLAAAKK